VAVKGVVAKKTLVGGLALERLVSKYASRSCSFAVQIREPGR
jgi:hypothetical protein